MTVQRRTMLQPLQIWRIPLGAEDHHATRMYRLLNESERHRAAQFRQPADQRRFVLSHGALRQILSQVVGCAPTVLPLSIGVHGKPFLPAPHAAVQFNLSHSQDLALLAVTQDVSVGVDVEWQRPLHRDPEDLDGLIEQVCSPDEKQIIRASADPELQFYQCWVAKEAALKCVGTGLSQPLPGFNVLNVRGEVKSVLTMPMQGGNSMQVGLRLLDNLPSGFSAALAVQMLADRSPPTWAVQLRDWEF